MCGTYWIISSRVEISLNSVFHKSQFRVYLVYFDKKKEKGKEEPGAEVGRSGCTIRKLKGDK